jgi:hypothetical protein
LTLFLYAAEVSLEELDLCDLNIFKNLRLTRKVLADLLSGVDVRWRVEIGHIGRKKRDDRNELSNQLVFTAPLNVQQ